MKKLKLTIILGSLLIAATIFLTLLVATSKQSSDNTIQITSLSPTATVQQTITYKGENGKDALTLLKKQAAVVQSSSGLVTAINGRKADDKKNEYWGFYINGKLAQVGPAQYKTKNSDSLMWKIEKY